MSGCYIHVWLCLSAVIAKEMLGVTVQTGLYSRVELTGEKLDQHIVDSLDSVEWTKLTTSSRCLCLKFFKHNGAIYSYSPCCGKAYFYLNNNSLILENVTAQVEGVFMETLINRNGTKKSLNFTLHILYPPNATGIVVSWTSNTSVSLRCEVTGSFTCLTWKRDDSSILEDNRHSFSEKNQTLHISNITSSHCGTYSCVATNAYGQSETQTYITSEKCFMHCENSTLRQEHEINAKPQINHYLITSGLTLIGVLGLCIILFYCIYKHRHSHRGGNDRTTEGDDDKDLRIYENIPCTEEVSPLPYVYTDFIKPRQTNQNSAAEHLQDFGYSEIGAAGREETIILDCVNSDEQSRPCPYSGEE